MMLTALRTIHAKAKSGGTVIILPKQDGGKSNFNSKDYALSDDEAKALIKSGAVKALTREVAVEAEADKGQAGKGQAGADK